jgi:hypothetical protein
MSSFDDLIGQRIKNKLIAYGYEQGFTGPREVMDRSINNLDNVIGIARQSVSDVIQGEIEVFASRQQSEEEMLAMPFFIAGLIHAKELIDLGISIMGESELD